MKRAALFYGLAGLLLISTSALGQSASPSTLPANAQRMAQAQPMPAPAGPLPPTPAMTPQYAPSPQYGSAPRYSPQEPVEASRLRRDAAPFLQGRAEINLQGGTAFGAGRDYFILGIGGGYYVVDGLRLGLQGAVWMFDSPFIFTVTPEVTYVMHFVPAVKPYIGAFYRGYIVGDNFEDTSTLGTRFGVNVPIAMGRGYFGVGGVYEHFLSCGEFRPCDTVYPEVAVAFAF